MDSLENYTFAVVNYGGTYQETSLCDITDGTDQALLAYKHFTVSQSEGLSFFSFIDVKEEEGIQSLQEAGKVLM